MKLLIVSDAWHPQVNGVVRTYEGLTPALEKMGHEVRVIGPDHFRFKTAMPTYPEIKLTLPPYNPLTDTIRDYDPDHIHIATEGPLGWIARQHCIKNEFNFSSCYHTQFPQYVAKRFEVLGDAAHDTVFRISRGSVRRFHSRSSALMVATQSIEDQLREWKSTAPMHRFVRGVDDVFAPGEKTLFQNLKRPVALYVGRVAVEKNVNAFLEMEWHGSKVIVGTGPDLEKLKVQYPDAVFAGKKVGAELAAHYRSADVFVFPSRTDTFGIVLIEALASGIPVAAYNEPGSKDIITAPYLGVLDENLSAAANRALGQGTPGQRAKHVKDNYTWEIAAQQFFDALPK